MKTLPTSRRLFSTLMFCTVTALLGAVAGCGGGSKSTVNIIPGAPTTLRGVIRSDQVTHAVTSTAKANADFVISSDNTRVGVTITGTNLSNATVIDIRAGRVGTDGPAIFTLLNNAAGQSVSGFTKNLTETDLTPQAGASINTFLDALNALANGECYVNVQTTTNPTGELRGQVGPVRIYAALNGLAVVPAVNTTGQGSAQIILTKDQDALSLTLAAPNLTNITSSTIRLGSPGTNGTALFTLGFSFSGSIITALNANDLTASGGINNFADAISALLAGRTYIDIRTSAQTAGEVRGQITPFGYVANLTSGNEVPALTLPALSGKLLVTLSPDKTTVTANLSTAGFTNSTVTKAHIHAGAAGVNGGPVFMLYDSATDGAFTGGVSKVFSASGLMPAGSVNTLADFINALNASNIYGNVHTQANPGGAIRGQLVLQP